jgi:hypothetical protein
MTDRTWIAERWDQGLWDQAHWNGQLGFNAQVVAVTVNAPAIRLPKGYVLPVSTGTVEVQGIPVICRSGRGVRAQTAEIIVTTMPIVTPLTWHLIAASAQVAVTPIWANLVPFFGCGELQFGIPVRMGRW